MKKRLTALLLSSMLTVTNSAAYASIVSDMPQLGAQGFTQNETDNSSTMPEQLTEEDIAAMNDGNVLITYSDEGYVSTIAGKYYDGIVQDQEDAIESIKGIALLLGLGKGCEFFCVYGGRDGNGYTYWTFQQRYGGYTLQYATLRVIVDPEGYTAGLTSSFVPNVGIVEETDVISPEQAEQIVLNQHKGQNLTIMSEYTQRLAIPFNNIAVNCYAVYTNNPDMTESFNMPYYEHYVTTEGEYLQKIATNSLVTTNQQAYKTEEYFEGLEMTTYRGKVTAGDGTVKEIEVPVAYNPGDEQYYLADVNRKIMVAQYYDFCYQDTLNFVTSKTNDGWTDNNLLAYYNYCKAYDFYESIGITSVDDFGTPILVTVGYCDENRESVNNACYYGYNSGWICFAASDGNTYSDALDVCAHEFTHGVTGNSMQGTAYYNEYGAINEAYSDIMGNLCEMMSGETDDNDWLVAEKSGQAMRDMGNPNAYGQPEFVGDMYYIPPVTVPDSVVNDNGGVHMNNSLLGHIAYELDRAGMSRDDQCRLWLSTIEMITPLSDYDDLHALLLLSGEINDIDQTYMLKINELYEAQGLNGDRKDNALSASRDGYGQIRFSVEDAICSGASLCYFFNSNGEIISSTCPDEEGVVSALLPQGLYGAIFYCQDANGNEAFAGCTSSGWTSGQNCEGITVSDGSVQEISRLTVSAFPGLSLKSTASSGDLPTYDPAPSSGSDTLVLTEYSADSLTIQIPQGWNVEVGGEISPYVKVSCPEDPGFSFFFFSCLAPLFNDETERLMWSMYDTTGCYSYAPIINEQSTEGILEIWDEIVSFQYLAGGKALFPALNNIRILKTSDYWSLYSQYLQANESVCLVSCSTATQTNALAAVATGVTGISTVQVGYGMPCCLLGTTGIIGTQEQLDLYLDDLLACLKTLTFSDLSQQMAYQYSFYSLPNASEMQSITDTIASAVWYVYSN